MVPEHDCKGLGLYTDECLHTGLNRVTASSTYITENPKLDRTLYFKKEPNKLYYARNLVYIQTTDWSPGPGRRVPLSAGRMDIRIDRLLSAGPTIEDFLRRLNSYDTLIVQSLPEYDFTEHQFKSPKLAVDDYFCFRKYGEHGTSGYTVHAPHGFKDLPPKLYEIGSFITLRTIIPNDEEPDVQEESY